LIEALSFILILEVLVNELSLNIRE
jgi:hypothetical protein